MVKNFKGQVKISDVQAEFDALIKMLNDTVDEYNNMDSIQDIDYTKGGSTLAPMNYTLTVGGLKQFMQIMDGYCFGVRVFKTAENQCRPTAGILVTKDKFYRIPTDVVNGYGTKLYYNPTQNKCIVGGTTSQTQNVVFPNATSNTNPFTVSGSYNSANTYKALQTTSSNTGGWEIGKYTNTGWGFSNITKTVGDSKVYDVQASMFDIRFTFSYKTNFTIKAGTVLSYELTASKAGTNIGGLTYGLMAFYGLGINNTNTLHIGGVDGGAAADSRYSFNVTYPATNKIRISYTFKKDVTCKSITIGVAPFMALSGNAQNDTTFYIQNCKFTGTVQADVTVEDNDDHEGLYKIADLNWLKTSSDKLWLNDLPNSM